MPMQIPSHCYDNIVGCRKRSIRQRKGTHPDAVVVIVLSVVFGIILLALAIYIICQWRRISDTKDIPPQNPNNGLNVDLESGEEPAVFEEYQDEEPVCGEESSESSDENGMHGVPCNHCVEPDGLEKLALRRDASVFGR